MRFTDVPNRLGQRSIWRAEASIPKKIEDICDLIARERVIDVKHCGRQDILLGLVEPVVRRPSSFVELLATRFTLVAAPTGSAEADLPRTRSAGRAFGVLFGCGVHFITSSAIPTPRSADIFSKSYLKRGAEPVFDF
jgi:hypothetical protein